MKLTREFFSLVSFVFFALSSGERAVRLVAMKYRLDFWLKPDLGSDQIKKELKDLEEELAKNSGGQPVLSFGSQTKKKLAYKIKGLSEGYFLTANLEVARFDPGFLIFLNRRPNVLRYLLTRLPI